MTRVPHDRELAGSGFIASVTTAANRAVSEVAQPLGQWGELVIDDVEDQVRIHTELLVRDDIAQTCDRSPRNVIPSRVSLGSERTTSPITARLRRTAS
jgi:hypothetical protein